jgi:hypothetical protein
MKESWRWIMEKVTKLYSDLKKKLYPAVVAEDRLREDFFLTFSTPHGKRVLAHMLRELHWFDEVVEAEEVTLANYARRLLFNLGIVQDDQIEEIVNQLLKFSERQYQAQLLTQGGSQ